MNYKKQIHETNKEIIWEIEEVVDIENGVYNTTYLADSYITRVVLEDNKVLCRYLYKEKKPEVITDVNSITIEYVTNHGIKKMVYKGIDKHSLSIRHDFTAFDMADAEISFRYSGEYKE